MTEKQKDNVIAASLIMIGIGALSAAFCAPAFIYIKNKNDSSIARDTKRVADALEAFKITKTTTNTVTKKPFSLESKSVVLETCGVQPEPLELRPVESAAR